jgi:hypothetical protein
VIARKVAIVAAVIAGLAGFAAAPAARAHTPVDAYVERTDYHLTRTVERTLAPPQR